MNRADPYIREGERLRARLRTLRVFGGELPTFSIEKVPSHPAELFEEWLIHAIESGVHEPHAMTLATVDSSGRPNSRVLILKGLTDGHWQFATSSLSRKGQELASSPWAAANFYWREIGRQVRLRGRVLDGGPEEAARDFLARPPGSRAESLIGNQSEVLADPADLDTALEDAVERVTTDPQLVAEHWTLYHLVPDQVEFWQADRDRRHVRLQYRLIDQRWHHHLLWP